MDNSYFIGLAGSGCDLELEVKGESEKAYKLFSYDHGKEFWMPKSAFDDDGTLLDWAQDMFEEKLGG